MPDAAASSTATARCNSTRSSWTVQLYAQDYHDWLPVNSPTLAYDDSANGTAQVNWVGGDMTSAFDATRMIGFCFAIPGIKPDGRPYLHSHMLGVLPESQRSALSAARLAAVLATFS